MPWTAAYHQEAVRIYAKSLPRPYQHDLGALFSASADTMAEQSIPARLAEDWIIVTKYLRACSEAIAEFHAIGGGDPQRTARAPPVGDSIPMVIRFDALARLTTTDGAERLLRAAFAVQQHVHVAPLEALDPVELRLLKRVAGGVPIVELSAELGHSERSTYRALANLWKKLGVPGRSEGLEKAADHGLI